MSRWLVANRLPAILPPQPKHARGTQRYANYVVELWTVFVPADRCAGRVLCYERMLESLVHQSPQCEKARAASPGLDHLAQANGITPTACWQ
jgi:hypothetical protein